VGNLARSENSLLASRERERPEYSLQQRHKSRLLEVVIRSEGFGDSVILHDDKRDAIGQRPIFIRPLGEEFHPPFPEISRGWDYQHIRIVFEIM